MLISVTNFFRDREAFEVLEREVIPVLMDGRPPDEPLRAWVAGCATGEEAYSLAILLRERAEKRGLAPTCRSSRPTSTNAPCRSRAPGSTRPPSVPMSRRRA